ncbi:MAG: DNA-directed RNA polymerase subunit beta [Chloroflexi bacterium]|jgi:DNA-directed RNA polymerase subunit beta|nr:MAG: DNA-directed RNA polymerase subunit beta [Chloroflexota bacterium]
MVDQTLVVNRSAVAPHRNYAKIPQVIEVPSLIQVQLSSFKWLQDEGLREVFAEISPIEDFTGNRFQLHFLDYEFRKPKYSEEECRKKETTFSAPLYVRVQLRVRETGEIKEQQLFTGDIPQMTPSGTFIINGAERVVVSQLVRSPGAYFTADIDPATGRPLCACKLIPYRGAWLEFETNNRHVISVKVDRKRKLPVTTLLQALGVVDEEDMLGRFADVDTHPERRYLRSTLDRDTVSTTQDEALLEFYHRLRPGEPPSLDNARSLLENLFFNRRRYDLGAVGRYKLNRRLGIDIDRDVRTLTIDDIVATVRGMIRINNQEDPGDDIDHLGNRRVRAVGELIQNQLRVGLLRMERVIKERMTLVDPETATPSALINVRPVVAAVREFFGASQLSQFMDQTNPLAELTHKRRLSALGPGGLSRERAGFDVRDVHHSHYGRICPIETPEGPNIGLLGSLAIYGRTNRYGFIETPYRLVRREVPSDYHDLEGRTLAIDAKDGRGKVLAKAGEVITAELADRFRKLKDKTVTVRAFVSQDPGDTQYLAADDEERYVIAQANSALTANNEFSTERVETRHGERYSLEPIDRVDYIDVSPMQIVSVSTSLIPFLEHDDANRALMGSNMQRQAVPLLRPQAPLVGTGMERRVALDSGQVIRSAVSGTVVSVTGSSVVIKDDEGSLHTSSLSKYVRSNQGTCITHRPIVDRGERVEIGDPLADSSATDQGETALGQNVLVAFMSWEGYNFEDAIILSERLVKDDRFTSVHIEKYECEARDTKLGPEEITRDIPNVGEESLRDLDEEGIIRVGAEVGPGDILVGKITPKGETELTAEEKLLRAIFGEKVRDVKDTSLRVPHGERGKVIDVRVLTREHGDELPPGVNRMVRSWVAQTRKISVGDKMAGRHGNKGVVSRILPEEDLPFLPDGTPVDIILNPIGVPSRMNLGQVLEAHLGWAASTLGFRASTPVFDGARDVDIEDALARAWFAREADAIDPTAAPSALVVPDMEKVRSWLTELGFDAEAILDEKHPGEARSACLRLWLKQEAGIETKGLSYEEMSAHAVRLNQELEKAPPIFGKIVLRDGRTGEKFRQPVTVGQIYMMKLIHLVEDKVHARSTGPYSLITQQPLGGKAQFGGQRFGEMEVWALEAYSAAYNLQEVLTIKSDDVVGRVKAYEAIVKGEDVSQPGVPESFNVLIKELQSLGLSVELLHEEEPSLALAPSLGLGNGEPGGLLDESSSLSFAQTFGEGGAATLTLGGGGNEGDAPPEESENRSGLSDDADISAFVETDGAGDTEETAETSSPAASTAAPDEEDGNDAAVPNIAEPAGDDTDDATETV